MGLLVLTFNDMDEHDALNLWCHLSMGICLKEKTNF